MSSSRVVAILLLLTWAFLFVGIPSMMWTSALEEARPRWTPRVVERERVGGGAFRGVTLARFAVEGPPRVVHLAAMGCWILGMAFIPGAIAGLAGVFFMGIGLVSIPGLVLAARLFRLGAPLLRGDLDAPQRARDAAFFARVLNYIVLTICAAGLGLSAWLSRHGNNSRDASTAFAFSTLVALYACVSLVHARLLDRAAAEVDDELTARLAARSGVRVDVQADEHPAAEERLRDAHHQARASRDG